MHIYTKPQFGFIQAQCVW